MYFKANSRPFQQFAGLLVYTCFIQSLWDTKIVLVVNLVQLLPVSLLTYNCGVFQGNFSKTLGENKVLLYWNASEMLLAYQKRSTNAQQRCQKTTTARYRLHCPIQTKQVLHEMSYLDVSRYQMLGCLHGQTLEKIGMPFPKLVRI